MAEISPFRGIRFSAASRGQDLGDFLSPPFDMITAEVQKELLDRSRYNIVRVELAPREVADRYRYVAETQRRWIEDGVLARDTDASMYVTEEEFMYEGVAQIRRGFIAAVRLEEYDRGIIFPHERTRHAWVDDRVKMMQASRSAFSPLLVVYQDDIRRSVGGIIRAVAGGAPTEVATMAGGYVLRLWQLTDRGTIGVLQSLMSGMQLFIADGHHRYEASMRYRSSIRAQREIDSDETLNYRMMHLVSIDEPGLITRGYHRLIRSVSQVQLDAIVERLNRCCEVKRWGANDSDGALNALVSHLGRREGDDTVFGVYGLQPNTFHIARMRDDSRSEVSPKTVLDRAEYTRLHADILVPALGNRGIDESVDFEHDIRELALKVDDGSARLGVVMRPLPMPEFVEIVSRGERLPPKATNFYPKPPAGSVIQSLDGTIV